MTASGSSNQPNHLQPGSEVELEFPLGHFYSPIPDLREVRARQASIFDRTATEVAGIASRAAEQLALLADFAELSAQQPFADEPGPGQRYGYVNDYFSHGDGLVLYCMLRTFAPRNIIEVGSGWSSALMLDVNDAYFDGTIDFTFIEPYSGRLRSLLTASDLGRVTLLEQPVQELPADAFGSVRAGDLVFIDSTHVSRVGSDVNHLLLDVVPSLPPGVIVHVHDIFWPFEYPQSWVYGGRAWNENYLLRALLAGNSRLDILWFNDYLAQHHFAEVAGALPRWARNTGGSIYLRTA